jgi:hypothetical protein
MGCSQGGKVQKPVLFGEKTTFDTISVRISRVKGVKDSVLVICSIWSMALGVIVNRVSLEDETIALWFGKVMCLALEGEFREMVNLGKQIQGRLDSQSPISSLWSKKVSMNHECSSVKSNSHLGSVMR